MRSKNLNLALMQALLEGTATPTDNLSPTATNHVYIMDIPDVPAAVLPPRLKSKCKKHRREARGW